MEGSLLDAFKRDDQKQKKRKKGSFGGPNLFILYRSFNIGFWGIDMNKSTITLISILLIIGSFSILTDNIDIKVTAQMKTRGFGDFEMDMNISDASFASFIGEGSNERAGCKVSGAGDVNGDGYDDVLITALEYLGMGITPRGKIYLIFGSESGWTIDTNLSGADASFIGESKGDEAGEVICGEGDVNGDGYDDFLISSRCNDENGNAAGQIYLIFGKASGWARDTTLSNADASFLGETARDYAGESVSCTGDVNGDGYNDIIISTTEGYIGGNEAVGKTYLIFGKSSGWAMDTDLSQSDASFIGESILDRAGGSISICGDVNSDGYDDIIIGANGNDDGGVYAGQTYLILGKASGWTMDTDLSNADASFWGEDADDISGCSVSGAGDVNGDGYDDILIGAYGDEDGGSGAGQTYLVLGKASGWVMDTDLSNADASFWGEDAGGASTKSPVAGAGDVNSDGYDDIIIGANGNDEGGVNAGQTYLILGKASGWAMDTDLSSIDASFIGERAYDYSGRSVSGAGDMNGDGCDDIIIGASGNDEGGNISGQTYLIPGVGFSEPLEIYNLDVQNGQGDDINFADIGDLVHVEMMGLDSNATKIDRARVNISFSKSKPEFITRTLRETGINTGIYQGSYLIPNRAIYLENITFSAYIDPTKKVTVQIHTPIQLRPINTLIDLLEDTPINITCWNFGYNGITNWNLETNAEWIGWDPSTHTITGTPDNSQVGDWWVLINITDGIGHYDEKNYTIQVINTPPSILTEDLLSIKQDEYYFVDYDSDDEGLGNTMWKVKYPIPTWLRFDPETGILNGTPQQIDVGTYRINISIDDGNEGVNWTEFNLEVVDKSDPPQIITEPITSINQGSNYYMHFSAIDPDGQFQFIWDLHTNASWLSFNPVLQDLSGTPSNDEVRTYFVNVTVTKSSGPSDFLNYSLEVIDVNDPPGWITVPGGIDLGQGEGYSFDVDAIDVDPGDIVTYRIESDPEVGIVIDPNNGVINWIASLAGLNPNLDYTVQVAVYASDGDLEVFHWFTIRVLPNPPPICSLLAPEDGLRVPSTGVRLSWEGHDDGSEIYYDLYLGDTHTAVAEGAEGTLWKEDMNDTFQWIDGLEQGKIYFWTVIPRDPFSFGSCSNSVFSFKVNSRPVISPIPDQTASVGHEFKLSLTGSDGETAEKDLEFTLVNGPEDMELTKTIIFLIWTPTTNDLGIHTVEISLFDGMEYTNVSFDIDVKIQEVTPNEPDDDGPGALLFIVIGLVVLLIVIGLIICLVMRKRKGSEEEAIPNEEDITPPVEEAPQEVITSENVFEEETAPPYNDQNPIY